MFRILCTSVALLLVPFTDTAAHFGRGPVQVFILAGQSNMEGHGMVSHLTGLIDDPETSQDYRHLRAASGDWIERDDVWIAYGGRRGKLRPGYGASGEKLGPELGFGWVMGEQLQNQVLLIKTCWGGHSLKEKFLPPSSGGPGPSYTKMVAEVHDVLDNLGRYFSEYRGGGYEIAGFVWHQAWNDLVDGSQKPDYPDYAERQANLLRDLRLEFNVPNMVMTIGELGTGGVSGRGAFQKAQEATALMPEFRKSVRFVKTAEFMETDSRYIGNRPYHYNGSGRTYYLKGQAFAYAMLTLLPRVSFSDLKRYVDTLTGPAYRALKLKDYAGAYWALETLEAELQGSSSDAAQPVDAKTLENRQLVYDVIERELMGELRPAIARVRDLRETGDVYALSLIIPDLQRKYEGIDIYFAEAGGLVAELSKRAAKLEIALGKKFYKYIYKLAKAETKSKKPRDARSLKSIQKSLGRMAEKEPDSIYGKAAALAAERLANFETRVAEPAAYVRFAAAQR